ncbi:MAG TPA: DUF1697 domain-containing protein [Acidimicrobiia bacterium]|nr:DUF1697 domain-containing protein [Acidimicrobiia bacterium]
MTRFAVLARGLNVGGKNKVPMSELRTILQDMGYTSVSTYIASGNVTVESAESPAQITTRIETALIDNFEIDDETIKVLVLSCEQLQSVVENKPEHFGDEPDTYHSDAIFLIGGDVADAMEVFSPRDGVDQIWPGDGVIYSQRLSAQRTKSRLNKAMSSPLYKSMTIRSWNTTIKLLEMMKKA